MPQFDTFSFFSQLFWVFFAFAYLYLSLCFYLLPALAAVLKIRTKKLSQIGNASISSDIVSNKSTNLLSVETWVTLFDGSATGVNFDLVVENETYYQSSVLNSFEISVSNQLKSITFFA